MATSALFDYSSVLREVGETDRGGLILMSDSDDEAHALVEQAERALAGSLAVTEGVDVEQRNERAALEIAAAADFLAAGHFLALAEERDPAAPTQRSAPAPGTSEPQLVDVAAAITRAARGEGPAARGDGSAARGEGPAAAHGQASGSDTPADVTATFQAHVDAILTAGGEAIGELVGAVAWSTVGGTIGAHVSTVISASDAVWSGVVGAAKGVFAKLRETALRLFRSGIDKLVKLVGSAALEQFVASAKEWIEERVDEQRTKPGGIPGAVVARLVGAGTVAAECARLLDGKPADVVRAADAAAQRVVDRAAEQAKWMKRAASLVSWGGAALWASPAAPYLAGGIVLAIGLAGWQVQDCLDTAEPFRLPDATGGLRRAVESSVA